MNTHATKKEKKKQKRRTRSQNNQQQQQQKEEEEKRHVHTQKEWDMQIHEFMYYVLNNTQTKTCTKKC